MKEQQNFGMVDVLIFQNLISVDFLFLNKLFSKSFFVSRSNNYIPISLHVSDKTFRDNGGHNETKTFLFLEKLHLLNTQFFLFKTNQFLYF